MHISLSPLNTDRLLSSELLFINRKKRLNGDRLEHPDVLIAIFVPRAEYQS